MSPGVIGKKRSLVTERHSSQHRSVPERSQEPEAPCRELQARPWGDDPNLGMLLRSGYRAVRSWAKYDKHIVAVACLCNKRSGTFIKFVFLVIL